MCLRARALVCERARALVCARVSLCLNKGERNVGAVCVRACVYNQTDVCPVKYLEIQLNYITAISLARERSVLQLRVILVMVSVLFKTTKEGLVSKGC